MSCIGFNSWWKYKIIYYIIKFKNIYKKQNYYILNTFYICNTYIHIYNNINAKQYHIMHTETLEKLVYIYI